LQRGLTNYLRGEDVVDDCDDGLLGLAVCEWTRGRLGGAHKTDVGVHAHEHMLGGGDLAAGEPQRFAVRDGERNRLQFRDFHIIS